MVYNYIIYVYIYITLHVPGTLRDSCHALTSNPYSFIKLYYYYPLFSDEETEAHRTTLTR